MALKIEDYALIGNLQTTALVGKNGSIDWLCLPHFDSDACFASLLGNGEHGSWQVEPISTYQTERRYREDTLVLETLFHNEQGAVRLIDCMIPEEHGADMIRIIEGVEGELELRMKLQLRFDYGSVIPWIRYKENELLAIAGPDMVHLYSNCALSGTNESTLSQFTVRAGEKAYFVLNWHPSYEPQPPPIKDPYAAIAAVSEWWKKWSSQSIYTGKYREAVQRSLITLKALTHAPSGGIVAAPTTSLPEEIGGERNWDYRYCWIRDATFALYSLMLAGYFDEAKAWREWLLRAVAGRPSDMRIMYGITGKRRLSESVVDWLPGYEGSHPVRLGNGAYQQLQLDVYGEIMDAFHLGRRGGLGNSSAAWDLQQELVAHLEQVWKEADDGIWEVRGDRKHFTHSKIMAWVAFDRAIKGAEQFGLSGAIDRWTRVRAEIHQEVCSQGFDARLGSFVQYYGGSELDASLLMIPLVGFLPVSDPRVVSTIDMIQERLMDGGLLRRYSNHTGVDGLPGREGAFLACSFWMVDCLALLGRHDDATKLFERLLEIRNDVGLLAEQYDSIVGRQLGNFPQALSHIALINSARNLSFSGGPAEDREGAETSCKTAQCPR
jgi:GH15 family glucan-1,4-alpha-glucosidase